ncbi:MAG: protein-export chaperone SecB [Candidatus Cloacimonas sp.]|jgi:preprotein translocase subunit SecB|nr:protein-export chaperone SecB [Candidatus Cloacimonas sp.]
MDTKRQPGIKPIAIVLKECSFVRYPEVITNLHTDCKISYNKSLIDATRAQGILTVDATGVCDVGAKKVYEAKIVYIGIFKEDGDANLPLEEFMTIHAPAHIYPYAREYLSSLSMRSGMPMIVLPPLNIAALLNMDIEGTVNEDSNTTEDIHP